MPRNESCDCILLYPAFGKSRWKFVTTQSSSVSVISVFLLLIEIPYYFKRLLTVLLLTLRASEMSEIFRSQQTIVYEVLQLIPTYFKLWTTNQSFIINIRVNRLPVTLIVCQNSPHLSKRGLCLSKRDNISRFIICIYVRVDGVYWAHRV